MGMMVNVDAAIDAVQDVVSLPIYEFSVLCDKLEAIAVDSEPVKHGRWIGDPDDYFDDLDDLDELQCSVCGAEFDNISNDVLGWNYCPNCGAKMDLEGE